MTSDSEALDGSASVRATQQGIGNDADSSANAQDAMHERNAKPTNEQSAEQGETATATKAPRLGWFGRTISRRMNSVPLSTKLVACTLAMLVVGMFCVTFSIRQLVSNYLLQKTDNQLVDQAQLVYDNISSLQNKDSSQSTVGPNDYYMQIRDINNNILSTPLQPSMKDGVISQPVLPREGSMDGVVLGTAFTTTSNVIGLQNADHITAQAAKAPWRVIALKWGEKTSDSSGTNVRGVVYIGLSLSDQIDTVNTLTKYCALVSVAIVMLGGVIAALVIQQTLVPLKRIEKTAAKIAAGDLSQRVPKAPENTEVGSLAASLNSMLSRIELSFREQEESNAKMKRFVSDASHELRTPLAAIHGYAELYAMQRDLPGVDKRADESIAHIESSSARMTELVEDLLSLARLDEGRGIDITQQIRLNSILSDAADDLHALDPERGISQGTLSLQPSDGKNPISLAFTPGAMPEITLTADGSRLRQVITNIVGNIHRYTPADSPVEVGMGLLPASISPESLSRMPATSESLHNFLEAVEVGQSMQIGMNYAVVRFSDHGPGVPEEFQSQIFERFYTADPSRARLKGGTGLGMAIAQSVAKAHHGFICASTTDGGGLTLTVVLPVSPVEPSARVKAAHDAVQKAENGQDANAAKTKTKESSRRKWGRSAKTANSDKGNQSSTA